MPFRALISLTTVLLAMTVVLVVAAGQQHGAGDVSAWPVGRPSESLPSADDGPILPFEMEVVVAARIAGDVARIQIHRWYQETNRWRREGVHFLAGRVRHSLTVADGSTVWRVNPDADTYRRSDVEHMAQREVQHLETPNQLGIGPTDFDIGELMQWLNQFNRSVRLTGKETLRGVPTIVIEYQPHVPSGFGGRIWVDTSGRKMVILRHQLTDTVDPSRGNVSIEAEVASITYGASIDSELLRFEPEGLTEQTR